LKPSFIGSNPAEGFKKGDKIRKNFFGGEVKPAVTYRMICHMFKIPKKRYL
jgi:hypothetical protein